MKENKYLYTTEDLLQEENFISSVVYPDKENTAFWEELLREGKIAPKDFEEATDCIKLFNHIPGKLSVVEKNRLWASIEIENKKQLKRKLHRSYYILSLVAASLILAGISLTFYFYESSGKEYHPHEIFISEKLEGDIKVILPGQDSLSIEGDKAEIVQLTNEELQVNTQIITRNEALAEKKAKPQYQQIIVPQGKSSSLTLSDGSKLWINSGTRVAYSSEFNKTDRTIYVNGEIFLEVTPDKERPFIVKTEKNDITVHGTSFNVTAYADEPEQRIILVTGAVSVTSRDKKEYFLEPSQMLEITHNNYIIKTVKTEDYISWKEGYYIYEDEKLSRLLLQLGKFYGKEMTFTQDIESIRCSGKLDLQKDLDKILNELSDVLFIRFTDTTNAYHIYKRY